MQKFLGIVFLIFTTAVIPWISYVKVLHWDGFESRFFKTYSSYIDLFYWYKSQSILIMSLFLLLFLSFLLGKKILHKFKKKSSTLIPGNTYFKLIFYYCIISSVLLIISALLSENAALALWGFPEQNEGLLILLSYNLIFLAAYLFAKQNILQKVLLGYFISACFLSLLSIAQFNGYIAFNAEFVGKYLTDISDKYIQVASIWGENQASATLYNPNYLGSYCSMVIPIFMVWSCNLKNKKYYYSAILFQLLLFGMLFTSLSRAGLLGVLIALSYAFLISRKKILLLIPALATCFILFKWSTMRTLLEANTLHQQDTAISKIISSDIYTKYGDINKYYPDISELTTINNKLIYRSKTISFDIIGDMNSIRIYSTDNAEIPYTLNNNVYTTSNFQFSTLSFLRQSINGRNIYTLEHPSAIFKFAFAEKGARIYDKGAFLKAETPAQYNLIVNDLFASYRGYIWRRSLPLLMDTLFIGKGPGHFPLYFPQNDYASKINYFGSYEVILNKPHNLYIQIAHSSGVLSLIIFFIVAFIILIKSGQMIIRFSKFKQNSTVLNSSQLTLMLALSSGIIGYLVSGIFNDSSLGVAPIFWALFGSLAGLAKNYIGEL